MIRYTDLSIRCNRLRVGGVNFRGCRSPDDDIIDASFPAAADAAVRWPNLVAEPDPVTPPALKIGDAVLIRRPHPPR